MPITPFFALIACSGKGPDVVARVDDTTDTDSWVVDTGPEGGFIDAVAFAVVARFGFDPATSMHRGFAWPGEALSPYSIDIVLLDSDALYSGPNERNSCRVSLLLETPVASATWVPDAGGWTGFTVPAGVTVVDQCRFFGLPAEFGGDAAAHVTKWQWGAGVGPLDEAVEDALREGLPASEWAALETVVVGAVGYSDLLTLATGTSPVTNQGYAVGYAVDGNFELVAGGTGGLSPLPAASVFLDPGVAQGVYEVQLGPWQPGTALALTPY